MTALGEALRKKYKTPEEAIAALGLDAALLATDPPVSPEQRRAMYAAAEGESDLGIPKKVGEEFVGKAKDKTMAKKAKDMLPKAALDAMEAWKAADKKSYDEFCAKDWDPDDAEDESEEEKEAAKEAVSKDKSKAKDAKAKDKAMDKKAHDKKAKDSEEEEAEEVNEGKKDVKQSEDKKAKDEFEKEEKKAEDKHAMDAAISAGIDKAAAALEKSIDAKYRDRYAAAEMVRPYIGEVSPMAFDSGDAIKVHALEKLGVKDVGDLTGKALDKILGYQAKAGARPVDITRPTLAMDSSARADALKYAPGLAKTSIGV